MEEHNTTRFFNQLIKRAKKGVKNIGIITDKDGTLLLNDSLREILHNLRNKKLGANIYIIANSGRTIQDMINCLKEENILTSYFNYIIGDNGAMCLDVEENKNIYEHIIDRNDVIKVIQEFIKNGATFPQIRITDGQKIFAYSSQEVKEYYKNKKDVIFKEDMLTLDEIDITKLTLSGSHEQINTINKYIKEHLQGYKTHMGKTSFPKKEEDNYRLDFTRYAYKRRSI